MVHLQLAIVAISTFLFCVSLATGKDTYETHRRVAMFGALMTIITLVAAVIKIIVTFSLEEDKAKGGWEIGMFIVMLVSSCCCYKIGCDHSFIPITLCLPVLLIFAETIKNFVTDDSTCLHPYLYNNHAT